MGIPQAVPRRTQLARSAAEGVVPQKQTEAKLSRIAECLSDEELLPGQNVSFERGILQSRI
jgi:hypothetical protein